MRREGRPAQAHRREGLRHPALSWLPDPHSCWHCPGLPSPSKALALVPVARPIPEKTVPSLCPSSLVGAQAIPPHWGSVWPQGDVAHTFGGSDKRKAGEDPLGPSPRPNIPDLAHCLGDM